MTTIKKLNEKLNKKIFVFRKKIKNENKTLLHSTNARTLNYKKSEKNEKLNKKKMFNNAFQQEKCKKKTIKIVHRRQKIYNELAILLLLQLLLLHTI